MYKGNPRGPSRPIPGVQAPFTGSGPSTPSDRAMLAAIVQLSRPLPPIAGPGTLSVIEVIWNMPARTLEYNLATLSAQIRPPLEIVVVNGSPERAIAQEAADVCERYPLARCVNVLLHKFNLSRMFNIGIRASRGEYAMLTSVDQVFAPNFLVDVYRLMAPGTFLGSLLGQLPEGYDLGEPGVLSACWPAIVADAEPPLKFSPGGIICIQRAWLERVRGYDETRTPYNYCDADLTSRAKMDGLDQDVIPDWTRTLHVRHGYKDALYYGLGGSLPDGKLPIVRNTANWGQE